MNEHLSPGGSFWERGRSERAVLMVVVMAFAAIALNDGVHSFTAPAGDARHKMKHFVLLFRQAPTPLSEADQKARSAAIVTWAQRQNDAGHNLDPRALGDERRWLGGDHGPTDAGGDRADRFTTEAGPGRDALSNILFLDARNFAEALEIARSHPGLRYGSTVEVRSWSPPTAASGGSVR